MTLGSDVSKINHPTRVRVKSAKGNNTKTEIFELKATGDKRVLERLGQYIKPGNPVTLLGLTECEFNNCPCKLGKLMGPDPRKVFVMILDDSIDLEPEGDSSLN
jgi:hypothetical protein